MRLEKQGATLSGSGSAGAGAAGGGGSREDESLKVSWYTGTSHAVQCCFVTMSHAGTEIPASKPRREDEKVESKPRGTQKKDRGKENQWP